MSQYLKAFAAAIVAGLTALITGLDDSVLSSQEYLTAAVAVITGFAVIWAVPNSSPSP